MNSGKEDRLLSNISEFLEVNAPKIKDENLGNFDSRFDEGIFLGYVTISKEYKCYNLRSNNIVEIPDVRIDEKFKYMKTNDGDHPIPEQFTKVIQNEERSTEQQ